MIILLDHNYTLVANSPMRGKAPPPMEERLATEEYRGWLLDMIRCHTVVLISARPSRWRQATLDRIAEQTGWQPDCAFFAPDGMWNPPRIKYHLMKSRVFPRFGREESYLAIESNPMTRSMYGDVGVACVWVAADGKSLRDTLGPIDHLPVMSR